MHGQAALWSTQNFANLRAYGKRRSSYAVLAASGSAEPRHGAVRTGCGWTVPVMSSAAVGSSVGWRLLVRVRICVTQRNFARSQQTSTNTHRHRIQPRCECASEQSCRGAPWPMGRYSAKPVLLATSSASLSSVSLVRAVNDLWLLCRAATVKS